MMKSRACPLVWNMRFDGSARSIFMNIAQLTMPSIISQAELRMIASRSVSFIVVPA
jgi:hypothetical protein